MEFTRIILKPMHTEKTYVYQSFEPKKLCFFVDPNATKNDISIAISTIYGVVPTKINTQLKKPHSTKVGTAHPGQTK
jgi:large subunit ribosomal protein L23